MDFGSYASTPATAEQARFDALLTWVNDNLAALSDATTQSDAFVDLGLTYLVFVIWPIILLVFIVLSALPLTCARCCCTTRCCAPRSDYVVPGYPSAGCDGYIIPVQFWGLLWLALAIVVIILPFMVYALAHAVSQWSCTVLEVESEVTGIANTYKQAFSDGLTQAADTVTAAGTDVMDIIDEVRDCSACVCAMLLLVLVAGAAERESMEVWMHCTLSRPPPPTPTTSSHNQRRHQLSPTSCHNRPNVAH